MPPPNGPSGDSAIIPAGVPARGKQLRDLTMEALAIFKRQKFNPLQELIDCYNEVKELDEQLTGKKVLKDHEGKPVDVEVCVEQEIQCKRLRFDIIKEIVQYGTPKLRSVEHTGQVDTGITVILGVAPKEVRTIEVGNTNHRLPEFVEDSKR